MITKTVVDELYAALLRYQQAIDRNAGFVTEKERVKNFLFTYRTEIYEMMKESMEAESRMEELEEKVSVQAKMIESLTQKLNGKKKEPPADKG